jgi:hypothetical protein
MDYKVKLTKCQNEHHHRDVFDTCTKWAKPPAKWGQGAGWPARVWVSSARDLVDTSLHRFTRNDPRSEGSGGQEEWPASSPFAPNQPCQVGGGSPLPLYRPPYGWRLSSSTLHVVLHLQRFQFSSSSTGEGLSGVESRVEHSLEL